MDFVLRREPEAAEPEYMRALRSRKAEVAEQLDQLHAAARFEPPPEATAAAATLEELHGPTAPSKPKPPQPSIAPEKPSDEESYTERLLKAKKKVWEEKKKEPMSQRCRNSR